jgi:hypothetical protein
MPRISIRRPFADKEFRKVSDVNQTLGIAEKDYLALGSPSRNNPGNFGT